MRGSFYVETDEENDKVLVFLLAYLLVHFEKSARFYTFADKAKRIMKVNFYLKDSQEPRCIIYCIITFDNRRISFSTKLYCNPKKWNTKKQRTSGDVDTNNRLNHIEGVCYSIFDRMNIFGAPDSTRLKKAVTDELFRPGQKQDGMLMPYYYKWATTATLGRKPSRQKLLSYKKIKEYAGLQLLFSDITKVWIENYLFHLENKGFSLNYIGTQLKNLKAVMNAALQDGLHNNTDFRKFKKMEEDSDAVYLTTEEIERIEKLPLLPTRHMIARDLFLIGYYTAMRFSDYSRLSLMDIENGIIKFATKKTGVVVMIPANPKLVSILERYGGSAPRMDESELNNLIKEVCNQAEIYDLIVHTRTEGGEKRTYYHPKYRLVSSHTARRSGATNMFLSGIKPEQIMMITGHKTYASFKRYIRIDKQTNAVMLSENEFFK